MTTFGEVTRPTIAALRLSWRSDLIVVLVSFVLVALVAGGVTAAQRSLEDAESDSLRAALTDAEGSETRLSVEVIDRFRVAAASDPLAAERAAIDGASESVDPRVDEVFGAPRLVVDSPRFTAIEIDGVRPASPTGIVLRVHDDVADRVTVVDAAPGEAGGADVEVAVTTATAERMGWALGTELVVESDPADPLFRVFTGVPDPMTVRVTSIVDLTSPDEPYWFGDARLHRPVVADTAIGAEFTVFALLAADRLPDLIGALDGETGLRVEQRRDLEPARIDLANADGVERAATSASSATSSTAVLGSPAVTVGLAPLLGTEADRRDTTRAAVALASVGAMATAVAALVQLQRVASSRRRPWWQQATARGAPPATLVAASVATTAVVTGAGVVAGSAAGTAIAGAADAAWRSDVTGLLVVFAVAIVVAALADQVVEVRRRIRDEPRRDSRLRRAAGVLVVVGAVASVVTVRRRGVTLDDGSVDPLLLASIVAVPLAAVVLVAAIVPRLLARRRVGSLRVGVGRLVGMRRGLAPQSEPGLLPVLALATTVAIIGVAVATSIGRGIEDQSWRDVGGPIRVDTTAAELVDAVAAQDGTTVSRYGETRTTVDHAGALVTVRFVSLDVDGHRRLTDGTAAGVALPAELSVGRDDGTVAAVTTGSLGGRDVVVGDRVAGVGAADDVQLTVVATVPSLFGFGADALLVDRAQLAALTGRPVAIDLAWTDGPVPSDVASDPLARVTDRAEVESARRSASLTGAAINGFLAAAVASALLAVVAVAAHLAVTMRARRRDLGLFTALGADGGEFGRSTRAELLPSLGIGVLVGALASVLLVTTLDGRLDLGPLTGADRSAIAIDLVATVGVVVGVVVAVGATIWVAGRWTTRRRAQVVDVLRAEAAT